MTWLTAPAHARWLETETDRLLAFAGSAYDDDARAGGGFAWLGTDGRPMPGRDRLLWITCRMVHVFALGHLLGRPGCGQLADAGVRALQGAFRDPRHGGWYAELKGGTPTRTDKNAYEHAFVVLAASSAAAAGRAGGAELLEDALGVLDDHFWDDHEGMVVEEWDESFSECDDYRGMNANMHTVEALTAAAEVAPEGSGNRLRDWARRITERALASARVNDWRLPEHHDGSWRPLFDYHAEQPAHPFRPYGATIGHCFEWSRLAVQLDAAFVPEAAAFFDAAVTQGWAVDGADGFVYTVDWHGAPVVRQRMHWVAAEAVGAAAALWRATGEQRYADLYEQWWDHIGATFLDRTGGSWWHEVDPEGRPSATVWEGKPDVYHALQATVLPRLPLAPNLAPNLATSLARAVRDGSLS